MARLLPAVQRLAMSRFMPIRPFRAFRPIAPDLAADGAVTAIETTGDLPQTELEKLQMVNHAAFFRGKLYVGRDERLLAACRTFQS